MVRRFSSAFLLQLAALLSAAFAASDECVYTIYIRTGSVIKAGTDSRISATLGDAKGGEVRIPDLEAWGLNGPGYDYYERGNLDIFSSRGTCLSGPLCRLNLTSDGAGAHHGWYCEYLEVTATGPHKSCTQSIFYVRQWLADDAPPYQLTALLDGCSQLPSLSTPPDHKPGPLVVYGDGVERASSI